jgi:hypothetical protein
MKKAILLLLFASAARADSVDLTDKVTIFGHIKQMNEKELVLTASFPDGKKVKTEDRIIPRNLVTKIEFDDATFNPGGAPAVGLRPSDESKPSTAPVGAPVAVLLDGRRVPCSKAIIDVKRAVHCDNGTYLEGDVLRLLMAGR